MPPDPCTCEACRVLRAWGVARRAFDFDAGAAAADACMALADSLAATPERGETALLSIEIDREDYDAIVASMRGVAQDAPPTPCARCNGRGAIVVPHGFSGFRGEPCPACTGAPR